MASSSTSYESTAESLADEFQHSHHTRPSIFRAPGRVNLIGEHTDYNDGFVMPAAIGFYTWVATSARPDRTLHVHSGEFHETIDLSLDSLAGPPRKHWSDFVRGVAAVLQSRGVQLSGSNMIIQGQVPMGAGLSSSASLEVATGLALLAISQAEVPQLELVKICQRAEHEYVGTRCGIMDQFIAVYASSGHALMIDCRSLDYQSLSIPDDARLVICNSMVKHVLASGEYNRRRAECEAGVKVFRMNSPAVHALRDVTMVDLANHETELPEVVYRRCRHVISENERVIKAATALEERNLRAFGELMAESHRSLRDDYEVSCAELDTMVDLANQVEGVYGARMTGGGFGGCTVNIVRAECVAGFARDVVQGYEQATNIAPKIYVCSSAHGAAVL